MFLAWFENVIVNIFKLRTAFIALSQVFVWNNQVSGLTFYLSLSITYNNDRRIFMMRMLMYIDVAA